jgi:hypothetical protein
MTINNALRRFHRPSRKPKVTDDEEPIAVGEVDQHVFNCPRCARPLGTGTLVCPGCGSRLLFGVRANMAAGFLVTGLVVGALLGGGVMYAGRPSDAGAIAAAPSAHAPSAAPGNAAASPTASPLTPTEAGVPSKAVAALRQAAILNTRFVSQAAVLRTLIRSNSTRPADIATVLRSVNTDALFGFDLAPSIAPWPAAAKVSADLQTFYGSVRDSAQSGLRASVSNAKAYRAAGKRMLALLARLTVLDAAAAKVVADAGLAPLFAPPPSASAAP